MEKTCLNCNHINNDYSDTAFEACPKCHEIYTKLEYDIEKKGTGVRNKIIAEEKKWNKSYTMNK